MSNHLAIATVTATLCQRFQDAVRAALENSEDNVTHVNPDKFDQQTSLVNVFLYQATANNSGGFSDVPTRSETGRLMACPQMALDLHYLVTLLGDDQLQAQQLLGRLLIDVHAVPWLSRSEIEEAAVAFGLKKSDLAEQTEVVRLRQEEFSLDDVQKLWSCFPETHYRLSFMLCASVVLLQAEVAPEVPPRPRTVLVSSSPRTAGPNAGSGT